MTSINFELQQPKQIVSLASSALVVSVDVNVWTATKQDKQISNEVTSAKRASADAGRFTKNLLADCTQHKALINYRQTVYNWLQRCTYDWAGSMRLLPVVDLENFKREYDAHEQKFNSLVTEFVNIYPSLVSDAAFKQGDMFNRGDYPDVSSVGSKFAICLHVTDVPASDFRAGGIASALADDLKRHYEKQTTQIIDQVMTDASERLMEITSRLHNACTEAEPDEDGKVRRKKIYESTVEQAKALCNTLTHFNLTGNFALAQAVRDLNFALEDVTAEKLRESSLTRKILKDDIDDMLTKFAPIKATF